MFSRIPSWAHESAPVFGLTAGIVATISVTVPAYRLPVPNMDALAAAMADGAMQVSDKFSYRMEGSR